ncbi:MAG: hypothetical protein IPK71_15615 [Myxococcales bacterium]|nr:hypothetical protein [Myxococcales bacterium]
MKALSRLFAAGLVAGATLLVSSSASAQSSRGAGYVQGNVLGFTAFLNTFGGTAFPMEFSGGYHINGSHEGFVIGGAQKFFFRTGFAAATVLRMGYDIAIPIKEMELTIAPYGYGGPAYGDIDLRAHFGFGVEGRFFPLVEGPGKGFFAVARPFEIGFIPFTGGTLVPFTFNLGAGYAF